MCACGGADATALLGQPDVVTGGPATTPAANTPDFGLSYVNGGNDIVNAPCTNATPMLLPAEWAIA